MDSHRDSSHSVGVGVVPCSSIAVDSTLRCGTAGLISGLCSGPYVARKNGIEFFTTYFAFLSLLVNAVSGVVNVMVAGSLAGAVVAATTRNWGQIVVMATLISAISAARDYTRSI